MREIQGAKKSIGPGIYMFQAWAYRLLVVVWFVVLDNAKLKALSMLRACRAFFDRVREIIEPSPWWRHRSALPQVGEDSLSPLTEPRAHQVLPSDGDSSGPYPVVLYHYFN